MRTFTSISSPSCRCPCPLRSNVVQCTHVAFYRLAGAANFARVLDQAAGGQSVTIERGKLRFRLVLDERRRALRTARPVMSHRSGGCQWDWTWRPEAGCPSSSGPRRDPPRHQRPYLGVHRHAAGRTLARASSLYISPVSLLDVGLSGRSQAYRLAPGARMPSARIRADHRHPMSVDLSMRPST